jgi:hypothetical protein
VDRPVSGAADRFANLASCELDGPQCILLQDEITLLISSDQADCAIAGYDAQARFDMPDSEGGFKPANLSDDADMSVDMHTTIASPTGWVPDNGFILVDPGNTWGDNPTAASVAALIAHEELYHQNFWYYDGKVYPHSPPDATATIMAFQQRCLESISTM